MQRPRTLHLDIIDYPGEWLLDLALLDLSYEDWANAALTRAATQMPNHDFLKAVSVVDGTAPLDEVPAKELAAAFADYLVAARKAGYHDCTPGRFLLPGDLAGSPVLTFAPLPTGDAPRRSLRREMARRYEAYKAQVVRPFFRDHFARIDRQVVLVDVLGAIHSGPASVEDMRTGLADILSAFRPGRNAFLTQLFRGRRVEKILFAATKADHLHHSQHGRLTAITEALIRDARDRAHFAGAETQALALASFRATTEDTITHDGAPLDVVRGTLLETGRQAAFYPGALPDDPSRILNPAKDGSETWLDSDYEFMRFAPAPLAVASRGWSAAYPPRPRNRVPDRRPVVTGILRSARPTDAGAVGDILSDFADTTPWMPRLHTRAEDLRHAGDLVDRGWVTVTETDGKVTAFAARDGEIVHALYVDRAVQRQGHGTALLAQMKNASPKLTLWTFLANTAAQAFYDSHGFLEVERTDGSDNDEGLPDIRLEWHKERV